MRVYVEMIYTIAVDVDPAAFSATTDDELLEALRDWPDFALEHLHNGPHACYEADWRIPDLWGHTRREYDAMGDQGADFEVLTQRRKR